jgi:nucleotide-binding universal stress UspA family protein
VLDMLLQPEASVTVLTVHDPSRPSDEGSPDVNPELTWVSPQRQVERRRIGSTDAAAAILKEAELGYGLIALGLTEGFRDTHRLSAVLRDLISRTPAPLLLVRHGTNGGRDIESSRRVLVPATGVRLGRAAEEVGAVLSARLGAQLDLVHVVARSDRGATTSEVRTRVVRARSSAEVAAQTLLDQAVERAGRFGATASSSVRTGAVTSEAILAAGRELGSDLLVLSVQSRALEGRPFLGHGTEYLLEHAPQTVLTIIFPPAPSTEE